jgi:hypothetical protein
MQDNTVVCEICKKHKATCTGDLDEELEDDPHVVVQICGYCTRYRSYEIWCKLIRKRDYMRSKQVMTYG